MNFEVQNALIRLDDKTQHFFVREALAERNPKFKAATAEILRTIGEERGFTKQLLGMLRLY